MTTPAQTPADAEALLVHAPFLRALARSLLGAGHPDEPDDVVQEAYLRATERPPRNARAGRGWLATVVRRLVAERGRREPRRARWEAAAARRDAVPSTDEIVQREAIRRDVVDAVVALAEPYRSAILLRFYEDLPPREIAARLGVPVETARTRVKRGLAKLQAQLDDAHGGDRRAWSAALAPLAWPTRAKAASLAWLPLTPKAVIAIGLAVVVAFTAWRLATPSAPADVAEPGTLVVTGADPVAAAPLTAAPDDETDGPRPLDVAPAGARLVFDVVDASGAHLADHVVALTGCPVPDAADATTLSRTRIRATLETRVARTTAAGRASFAGVPQGIWAVTTAPAPGGAQGVHGIVVALDPGLPTAAVTGAVRAAAARAGLEDVGVEAVGTDADAERTVTVARASRAAAGRTVDVDGEPVAAADVVVLPDALRRAAEALDVATIVDAFAPTLARVTTDAAGRFTAPLPDDGALLRAASPRHVPAVTEPAPAPGDTTITLRRRLGFSVAGRVVDADGAPLAGAIVALSDVAPILGDHDAFVDNVRRFGKVHTTSDVDGRFAFDDVRHLASRDGEPTGFLSETDPTLMVCASARERLPSHTSVTITDGTTGDVVVELAHGGEMTVRVDVERPGAVLGVVARGPGDRRTFATTLSDRDRSCTFFRVEHGTWRFVVERDLDESDEITVEWRGGPVVLRPEFSRPTWTVDVELVGARDVGTPQERDGGVAPTLAVAALREPPGDHADVADGRERVGDREALVLGRAWDDADEAWIVATCDGEVLDAARVLRGETFVSLDVTGARSTRGGLVVDVTRLTGESGFSTPRVLLYAPGARTPTLALHDARTRTTATSNTLMSLLGLGDDDERTSEVWGRVAPGRYDVVVRPISEGMRAALARDVVIEAGRVTRVTPEPLPTTQVVFSTPGTEGRAHRYALFDADGRRWIERHESDVPFGVLVPPGRYTAQAMTRDGRAGRVTFVVHGRDVERVTIPMESAAPTTITVAPTRRDDGTVLRVAVIDVLGRVVADRRTRIRDTGGAPSSPEPLALSLPTGTYTATLEVDGVEVDRATLTSGGASPLAVTLTDA